MVNLRKPIERDEMDKMAVYFIFLYEPATEWRDIRDCATQLWDAQRKARKQVDDACKTEGWVYKLIGDKFYAIGNAYLAGDGDIEWRQILSDHIFFQDKTIQGDGEEILEGWGFWDETGGCGGSGYKSIEEATEALKKYAETL